MTMAIWVTRRSFCVRIWISACVGRLMKQAASG
jgi:hypothetical protein